MNGEQKISLFHISLSSFSTLFLFWLLFVSCLEMSWATLVKMLVLRCDDLETRASPGEQGG